MDPPALVRVHQRRQEVGPRRREPCARRYRNRDSPPRQCESRRRGRASNTWIFRARLSPCHPFKPSPAPVAAAARVAPANRTCSRNWRCLHRATGTIKRLTGWPRKSCVHQSEHRRAMSLSCRSCRGRDGWGNRRKAPKRRKTLGPRRRMGTPPPFSPLCPAVADRCPFWSALFTSADSAVTSAPFGSTQIARAIVQHGASRRWRSRAAATSAFAPADVRR